MNLRTPNAPLFTPRGPRLQTPGFILVFVMKHRRKLSKVEQLSKPNAHSCVINELIFDLLPERVGKGWGREHEGTWVLKGQGICAQKNYICSAVCIGRAFQMFPYTLSLGLQPSRVTINLWVEARDQNSWMGSVTPQNGLQLELLIPSMLKNFNQH